jgi:uncharacterized protein
VSNFKLAVLFFLVTLAGYALVLFLFPNLQIWIPSYAYHVLILGFPLVLILCHRESLQGLGLTWGKWKFGVPAALVVIAASFLVWWLITRQFTRPTIGHILFSTVIWGPAAEELFFRGYLQAKLEARTGRWPGLIIASLLFGISHLPRIYLRQAATPPLVPEAVFLGFIFGLIRDRTGSVYYGMLCHMAYNLIVTVV